MAVSLQTIKNNEMHCQDMLIGASTRNPWHAVAMAPRFEERFGAGLTLAGLVALLAVAVAGLTWMGTGPLAVPSITAPEQWSSWAAGRDPVTIAFSILRVVTLVVAWYLLGATLTSVAARLLHSTRFIALADLLTVPAVRRLVQSAVGVGFAAAALTAGSAPTTTATAAGPVATATLPATDQVEMQPVTDTRISMVPVPPEPVAEPPGVAVAGEPDGEWMVEPGDHFWSIAEAVLADAWGRSVSDEEITVYWQRLVDANRSRLVDPANPDFILPGQRFRTPPP